MALVLIGFLAAVISFILLSSVGLLVSQVFLWDWYTGEVKDLDTILGERI